jgi:two-component system chemotaxis response regulator CheB
MQALQAGALAVVEKPPDRANPDFAAKQRQLLRTLAAMARVSVVRRGSTARLIDSEADDIPVRVTKTLRPTPEIIAIGASAGGPSALSRLLREFPAELPVPVVVVQHIPQEFINGLARWLEKLISLPVHVVTDGDILTPGVVHLSPGEAHLKVARRGDQLVGLLHMERGSYHYYPAIDVLFESVAEACGSAAVGVVLTGMGSDGAQGLVAMYEAGARTFAQDKASSTVYGMPRAAFEAGAVQKTLPLSHISTEILKLL